MAFIPEEQSEGKTGLLSSSLSYPVLNVESGLQYFTAAAGRPLININIYENHHESDSDHMLYTEGVSTCSAGLYRMIVVLSSKAS
jgi:hypothetical protein